jgi:hypothetical protein
MGHNLLGLGALLIATVAFGQDPPGKEKRVVLVQLSFSVDQFDATRPSNAVIKCMVRNNSPRPVHVPVGFDGGYIQLHARGLNLVKTEREKADVKLAWVEPGKERLVFELPLTDIFMITQENHHWNWTWQRRPAPPLSPIHKNRERGFMDQASFIVSIDLGEFRIESESATLKVKANGGQPRPK